MLFDAVMKSIIKALLSHIQKNYLLGWVIPCRKKCKAFDLSRSYLVSSEKGVFLLGMGNPVPLFSLSTFGIAMDESYVFLACSTENESFLLRADREAFLERKKIGFSELFCTHISDPGSRIHQIAVNKQSVWMACTYDNTLREIDKVTGQVRRKVAPFKDEFGTSLCHDHNHINSIFCLEGVQLFVAYKVGGQAMLCVMDDEDITGFSYPNVGVHDIIIDGENLYFSDTFGSVNSEHSGGAVIKNGQAINPEVFEQSPGFIVRGMAGDSMEMVIGHSHKGERSERYKGVAKLIRLESGVFSGVYELPFSQFYDVITFHTYII